MTDSMTEMVMRLTVEAAREEGRLAGKTEGLALLDKAWAEIEASIPYCGTPEINHARRLMGMKALGIIRRLGGMDPAKRI